MTADYETPAERARRIHEQAQAQEAKRLHRKSLCIECACIVACLALMAVIYGVSK